MSTELKQKELDYTLLAIIMIMVIALFCVFGCTPATVPQSTEKARQTQYQVKLIGSDVILYRNGKLVERKPSGLFTNDTVRSEIKTTTEKY